MQGREVRQMSEVKNSRALAFHTILFDLDGVLVDSFDAWYNTFNFIREESGRGKIPLSIFRKNLGCPLEEDIRLYLPDKNSKELNKLKDIYFARNANLVKLFPKSLEVLEFVKINEIKSGLVSNSTRAIVKSIIKEFKLGKFFDVTVTAEDVKHGKPSPEMVLKACKTLKVHPKYTIFVGDTKNDMLAGKRAGCMTIGYKVKGDYEISSLNHITNYLNQNQNKT